MKKWVFYVTLPTGSGFLEMNKESSFRIFNKNTKKCMLLWFEKEKQNKGEMIKKKKNQITKIQKKKHS